MCFLQCIPALRHHAVDLYANLKHLDNIAITLIISTLVFQYGKWIDRWAVVCVPFLSSSSEMKLFLEEAHIDSAVEANSADSYMCLYIGMNFVLLTASYTHPVRTILDEIAPFSFLYISSMTSLVNIILLMLVSYSIATIYIPYLATLHSKQFRAKAVVACSTVTFIMICSSLMLFIYYKEKGYRSEKKDVVKAMLLQFQARYGCSFYAILLTALLNIYVIKTSFFIANEPFFDRKLVESAHML